MNQSLLPLEECLRDLSSNRNKFPDRTVDYFQRYIQIKNDLVQNAFRNADAGLAAGDRGLYTHHDQGHVEDVIESAGRLLGVLSTATAAQSTPIKLLEPYEVYATLIAILLHDAGNADGREGHEQRAFRYLGRIGEAVTGPGKLENRYLASIAQAHGGRNAVNSKDTISKLAEDVVRLDNDVRLRSRLVAAIVRFADEISENPKRANTTALTKPYRNPVSVVHNLYCKVTHITVDLPGRTLNFEYIIPVQHLAEKFVNEQSEVYLVEYIAQRLLKCDRERQYCQRFFRDILAIDRIRAVVQFERDHEYLDKTIHGELREAGYPDEPQDARIRLPEFNGEALSTLATAVRVEGGGA